jgi:hypothetical protein
MMALAPTFDSKLGKVISTLCDSDGLESDFLGGIG